ncbi:3-galactosyl-N-acetylglucosaminide 4-alpha-L-fucosyltransferase FUT3-like [Lytechinus variegatus]|uniref:3-galactosyl-N-acetylglucosaminide 4-alpha-L-fucosyltransferase FUT3-like n=1 Tax=Lytechinus variegatus TaxID=7654 RepID=UPI001BB21A07|nr:3-galactosyl-N-acetylglucosaminide 4-alpha-L-fucosyltransferase FUT3-like [Lytechinus variegatus]XP_041453942.1 3-galactosyl-N-acetylglucosaminide 4-alpha-L-fucosyltransferase FUT3-like [Lytechinus variegatus]XP_041453943.1 3-galactosyl-N-acetylglucosaminide 4-alpha-L-fucosyltransferase FUT3-like [Lytechinus variegatus]XP_041453944.1 3-galactosyl-N-acetylglucosaminide 4-alpha-L-fucosyltransferase FUT3-like [Lytechinus variegatus]
MFPRQFCILAGICGGLLLLYCALLTKSTLYAYSSTRKKYDAYPYRYVAVSSNTTVTNHSGLSNRCVRYFSVWLAPYRGWTEYAVIEDLLKDTQNQINTINISGIILSKEHPTIFQECPDFACDVVIIGMQSIENRTVLEHSDAIFLNFEPKLHRDETHKFSEQLMEDLPSNIKIIFYSMESPLMLNYFDPQIDRIKYHIDMTYFSDTDVHLPYGRYIFGEPTDIESINYAENKTDLLVWVASNCKNTFWPRIDWVKRLEKLITFDTYGRCGENIDCLPRMSPECARKRSHYKFILALENAQCDGYVTEKFWLNGVMNGVVPIVYGGTRATYEHIAPPNSFIHIGDFSSQQELVNYLLKVDKNDSLYNEFFAWRRQGHIEIVYPDLKPQSFCKVLPKLSESTPVKYVGDSNFFQSCRGGAQRPFSVDGDIENWTAWK